MNALVGDLPGSAVIRDASLQLEFEQCLAGCPTLAYRVALGVLHNPAEAEDVAQEAILRAYRNFHRLRDRQRFRGWLVRTAWRLSLDRIRAASRRERRERVTAENRTETNAESIAATREFERQVAAALEKLPEKQRLVMILAPASSSRTASARTVSSREPAVLVDKGELSAARQFAAAIATGHIDGAALIAEQREIEKPLQDTPIKIDELQIAPLDEPRGQ